jgi:DNA-3-methyladenine glycosylase II
MQKCRQSPALFGAFSLVYGTFRRRSFHRNWMCLDFVDEYLVCQTLYFVVLLHCTSLTSVTSMLRTSSRLRGSDGVSESVSGTGQTDVVMTTSLTSTAIELPITGPFDLRDVAMMGFGHRDERSFDGVMRMAFCLDGDYERQVGVAARQSKDRLELQVQSTSDPLSKTEVEAIGRQVARVVSLDYDGEAFHQLCLSDPALARVHMRAPGFRPALFYSPYEAALWSIMSARRARSQAITLRAKLSELYGASFELAGTRTLCVPTPSAVLRIESVPGLPVDRIPRLHAVAVAAQRGQLDAERLRAMPVEDAQAELQQLPGIGPFYSSLIVIRACGHADVPALGEPRSRAAIQQAYGFDHELSDDELLDLSEAWRPFRTWVSVMMRALSDSAAQ